MKSEKLLYAVGMIDESMIEEAAPERTTAGPADRRGWFRKSVCVAACAAAALFAVFAFPQTVKAPVGDMPGEDHSVIPGQTDQTPVQMNIAMNELEAFPSETQGDIGLFWDDYIPMTIDELNEYYGTDIRPAFLPDTIEKQMAVDVTYGNPGIFKRADGAVYYDNNSLKYQSADRAQSVVVSVAKGHLPRYDVLKLYEGDLQASDIGGNSVWIAHYKDEEGEHYYAEFLYNNVGFNLWGNNIAQGDFVETVAAYFER